MYLYRQTLAGKRNLEDKEIGPHEYFFESPLQHRAFEEQQYSSENQRRW